MYKLFANCIRIKGHRRAIIYDLQRNVYHLIPHSLHDLFDEDDVLIIDFDGCTKEELEILNEYLSFLIDNNLIFPIDEDELLLFPKLNRSWEFPSIVTNMIIDINGTDIDWKGIKLQMEKIKCYYLQVRFFSAISMIQLESIAVSFFSSLIQAFEILAPYNKDLQQSVLSKYVEQNPKVRSIIFYSAPENDGLRPSHFGFGSIIQVQENITGSSHCGVIHPSYFSVNIETFTESLSHNTCLNRKISIDVDGNIKNCPSMKESFGNIKDTTLEEAINKQGFKKYWNITKDEISKCKDCEFRHVCTDCRAYLENPDDIYSAPLKCGYNPYTCEWEEWSTNPLKEQAIAYYGLASSD